MSAGCLCAGVNIQGVLLFLSGGEGLIIQKGGWGGSEKEDWYKEEDLRCGDE